MERNRAKDAVILQILQNSKENRTVIYLTEDGIEFATVFGGPKSKLFPLIAPFSFGKIWIYENAQQNFLKVIDFAPSRLRLEIRENLFKIWAASFSAELLIKTFATGENYRQVFALINFFLDGICLVNEHNAKTALIRFLWRYFSLLGEKPDAKVCAECGKSLFEFGHGIEACYVSMQNAFFCVDCLMKQGLLKEKVFHLSALAIRYLNSVDFLSPKISREIILSNDALLEIKEFLFFFVKKILNSQMKTLLVSFW